MNLKQLIQLLCMVGAIALVGCNVSAKETPISPSLKPAVKLIAAPNSAMSTAEKAVLNNLLRNSKKLGLCRDYLDLEAAKRASEVYKLENQQYFVMFHCFLAAYQGN